MGIERLVKKPVICERKWHLIMNIWYRPVRYLSPLLFQSSVTADRHRRECPSLKSTQCSVYHKIISTSKENLKCMRHDIANCQHSFSHSWQAEHWLSNRAKLLLCTLLLRTHEEPTLTFDFIIQRLHGWKKRWHDPAEFQHFCLRTTRHVDVTRSWQVDDSVWVISNRVWQVEMTELPEKSASPTPTMIIDIGREEALIIACTVCGMSVITPSVIMSSTK